MIRSTGRCISNDVLVNWWDACVIFISMMMMIRCMYLVADL